MPVRARWELPQLAPPNILHHVPLGETVESTYRRLRVQKAGLAVLCRHHYPRVVSSLRISLFLNLYVAVSRQKVESGTLCTRFLRLITQV